MTGVQRTVLALAGLLIAARLFVPVTECTLTNPFTRVSYSYQLPRFIPWNYVHYYPAGKGVVLRLPPDWASGFGFRYGTWHEEHGGGPDSSGLINPLSWLPPHPVPTTESGTQAKPDIQDVPEGSSAYWDKDLNMWTVIFPQPSQRERIMTLDPGGYWQTACDNNWAPHTLLSVTLLHVLGIATIVGVLFVVLPRHTAPSAR